VRRAGTGRWALAALAVLLLAAGPLAQRAPAAPGDFGYHWGRRDRGSLELRLGENLDAAWEGELRRAAAGWERSGVAELRVVRGAADPLACAETRGRVEVCNADYGATGWLGLTRVYYDANGHTTAATVRLNDRYFAPGGPYDDPGARRHTVCHELGHALGLGHTADGSCMNDAERAIFANPSPIGSDFRALRRVYGHRDAKRDATVGGGGGRAAGVGAAGGGFVDLEQGPEQSAGPADRRTRTVEALPGGGDVATFVDWAG
jgi:hypothetical protein